VIAVLGRFSPGVVALIARVVPGLDLAEKMPAIVEGDSLRLLTPDRCTPS